MPIAIRNRGIAVRHDDTLLWNNRDSASGHESSPIPHVISLTILLPVREAAAHTHGRSSSLTRISFRINAQDRQYGIGDHRHPTVAAARHHVCRACRSSVGIHRCAAHPHKAQAGPCDAQLMPGVMRTVARNGSHPAASPAVVQNAVARECKGANLTPARYPDRRSLFIRQLLEEQHTISNGHAPAP